MSRPASSQKAIPPSSRRVTARPDWRYVFLAFVGLLYLTIGLFTAARDRSAASRVFCAICLASFAVYTIAIPPPLECPRMPILEASHASFPTFPATTASSSLSAPTARVCAARLTRHGRTRSRRD